MNTTALCLRELDYLFTPFHSRKLTLPTRLVMAPVSCPVPHADRLQYYRHRAAGELGLIITEPLAVCAAPDDMPRFYGGAALRAWKGIARAVHAEGCRIAPQLSCPCGEGEVESMSRGRMHELALAFGRAAAAARTLGFDAVVIDGAGAHLIEQFLRPDSNKRHDEYGGDIVRRVRFASRVVQGIRKWVGRHFPVIFRFAQLSPGGGAMPLLASPAELQEFLHALCESGVDIFACAGGQAHLPVFRGSPLNLAGWVRLLSSRPVITEGGIGRSGVHLPPMVQRLRAQEFDLIAVGRALAADAEWGSKWREAREHQITPPPA